MNLIDQVPKFLQLATNGRAPNTQRNMRRALERFSSKVTGVDRDSVASYFSTRSTEVAASMVELERVYVNKFFEWCFDTDLLLKNPLRGLPHLPVTIHHKPILSTADYTALKAAALGHRLPLVYLITLAWNTGHRLIDLCFLRWDSVAPDLGTIRFIPEKTKRRGLVVELPTTTELQDFLHVYHAGRGCDPSPYVSPILAQVYKRDTGTGLHKQFKIVAVKAGLPAVTLHCFRHTRATRMGEAGIGDLDAAATLGMESLSTLKKYKRTSMAVKRAALEA